MTPLRSIFTLRRGIQPAVRCALGVLGLVTWGRQAAHAAPLSAAAQARTAAENQAFADSAVLYSAGNFSEAERVLTATNRAASGTGAWQLETARRLFEIAHHLRVNNRQPAALSAAAAALQHISAVTNQSLGSYDAAAAPKAWELAGYIYDSLLADSTSALFAYRQAVALNPTASRAQAEVARLTRVVDTLSRGK